MFSKCLCKRCLSTFHCEKNVVVTGMGMVTPLGTGVDYCWSRLLKGDCGISKMKDEKFCHCKSKVAGIVPKGTKEGEFDIKKYITHKYTQNPLFIAYALASAEEAFQNANIHNITDYYDTKDCSVCIGTGVSNIDEIYYSYQKIEGKENPKLSPFFIPRILGNSPAGQISMRYHLNGGCFSMSTACAAGANSIADGYRLIQENRSKLVVCGGTEMPLLPMGFHGFSAAHSLSTHFNDQPEAASRPFDERRDGFVMAEGAGVLILEEEEAAKKRNAPIICLLTGVGYSSDAYNVTQPHPEGKGALKAMRDTLQTMNNKRIDYVNAHATGTPLGDRLEYNAIVRMNTEITESLQDENHIYVSSTKGSTGHLLGAAGAIEAIFTCLAIQHNVLPPMIHLDQVGSDIQEEKSVELIHKQSISHQVKAALSNSFGFGGVNVCLGFEKY